MPAAVLLRLDRLSGDVLLIPIGEIVARSGRLWRGFLGRDVLASVAPLAQFPCFLTSRYDRPIRIPANGIAALDPVNDVVEEEGAGAVGMSVSRCEYPQAEAL